MCSPSLTNRLIRFGVSYCLFFDQPHLFCKSSSKAYEILILQFTVLQNGCWQKVNFGKKRAHLGTSSEPRSQKNSLRCNPASPNGNYILGTAVQGLCNEEIGNSGDKAFTRTSMRNSARHEYPAQSTAGNICLA